MIQQAQKIIKNRGVVLTETHSNVRFRTLLFRFRSELSHFNRCTKNLYVFVSHSFTVFGTSYVQYESIR